MLHLQILLFLLNVFEFHLVSLFVLSLPASIEWAGLQNIWIHVLGAVIGIVTVITETMSSWSVRILDILIYPH